VQPARNLPEEGVDRVPDPHRQPEVGFDLHEALPQRAEGAGQVGVHLGHVVAEVE
jgi:hypothetical protein